MKKFQLNFITNKTIVRWFKILYEFEKNNEGTAAILAMICKSTRRTIGTDIQEIRDFFGNTILLETTQQGYTFKQLNFKEYTKKKAVLLSNEPLFVLVERLFQGEVHSIEEWAEIFHLSPTTTQKYFQKMQHQLDHFGLKLSFRPVMIQGNEMDIRSFYFSFFYESEVTPHTIFPTVAVQQAVNEIGQLFNKDNYHFSSFTLTSYLLLISIERYLSGNRVSIHKDLFLAVQSSVQLMHFQKINYIMENYFNFVFPEEEVLYLFISIVTQRTMRNTVVEQKFCLSYNHWPEIGFLTKEFFKHFFPLQYNKNYKPDLILLESFFTTAKLKACLNFSANKNIEDINDFVQKTFSDEYSSYLEFLYNNKHYLKLYSLDYLPDFCANLVIYLEYVRERYWGTSKNIAFIFEGNRSICQFIENLAKKYLHPFQSLFFPDSGEVNAKYLEKNKIDILVTNYSEYIADFDNCTECILFRSIPTASDWNKLLAKVNPKITYQYKLSDRF